jgi:hypothetical protein
LATSTFADASDAYVVSRLARTSSGIRDPGRTASTSRRPSVAASAVDIRKYAIAFPPTRPTLRRSPRPATPSAIDASTSGITIMNRSRRKIWPIGPARYLLTQTTVSCVPPSVRFTTTPRIAPRTSPMRILV